MVEKKKTTAKLSVDVLEYVEEYRERNEIDTRQETIDQLLRQHMEGRVTTSEKEYRRQVLDYIVYMFWVALATTLSLLVAHIIGLSKPFPVLELLTLVSGVFTVSFAVVAFFLFVDICLWVIGTRADELGGVMPAVKHEFPRIRGLISFVGGS